MPKLEVNPFEYDSRMTEWNLKVNKITQDQLTTFLKTLPDDAANTETMKIEEDDSSLD
jgi:hypothetical protein